MQQYVCVRIARMDDVDIGLFEYDRYNTLYFFFLNADEHIYMRYGGRDGQSQDTFLSLDSLELALAKGLELHKEYLAGRIRKSERPKPRYPREIPLLVERTFSRNNCVECHLIGDFDNIHREQDGTLDKPAHMYRSPDIRTLGIHLDVPKGLVVKEIGGAAGSAGMKPGDRIAALNGTRVWTFADLQHYYDRVPRTAERIRMTVERNGAPVDLTVDPPVRWWWTDIRFRQMTIDPRVYFDSRPLTNEQKREHKLETGGFASMVTHVDTFAQMMKSHGLRVGDIIVGVDGVQRDPLANTAELFIKLRKTAGDSVTLDVIREGKRLQMPLQTFRMSFRK